MVLEDFEPMWTTEAWKYVLVRRRGYLPVDVSGDEPMIVLIDENDALADAVASRMKEAGVPVVDDQGGFANRNADLS